MRVDELLPTLLRSDPARPRITCYDDGSGERIELSGRVLNNWVAKAANLLQDEFDAGPGTRIRLDLPPHWRTAYWALAGWAVGATLDLSDAEPDVLVSADPAAAADSGADGRVVVTLAALARGAAVPLEPGVMDEARELAGYPDQFSAWARAGDTDLALVPPAGTAPLPYAVTPPSHPELTPATSGSGTPGARVHLTASRTAGGLATADFLALLVATYAADGSLVLSLDPDPQALAARLDAEGATESR